jgi:hypothetical protein
MQPKKEIVYTMQYQTAQEIQEATALRNRLYEKYNSVNVYPQGSYAVQIVASDEINHDGAYARAQYLNQ